jgi:hypothetical protein
MQIGRHLIGRRYGGSEKINAFHGFPRDVFLRRPMNEFTSPNTVPALLRFIAQSHKRLECRTSTVALEDVHLRWKRCVNAAAERNRNAANQLFR